MSVESCSAFLRVACNSPEVRQQLKAVTGTQEIVKLGLRNGYDFGVRDLIAASSSFPGGPRGGTGTGTGSGTEATTEAATGTTAFYHHEYRMTDIPGFESIIAELPRLKIKPPSVDLAEFAGRFRDDDLRSTSMSPADPEFRDWYENIMKAGRRDPALGAGAPRRDFHLVNLDEHVEHPDYEQYFDAKFRTIAALEEFFGSEIRFSGSLWYPPSSYRLWHTNETQPGWRMYIVDFDAPFPDPGETSFFRYMNPETHEIVTLRESPQMVRFFKAEQDPGRLFWHCIVNPTTRHRWSFGFVVPDHWADAIQRRT
ncbi:MAG TPA: Nif11-like leader peptide family natural product precursor [Streptosporangiaceae bacterium]|nr:Nif11-like leader peptide family natural product precursor [Streptosporangiaceae bacterium]